VGTRRPCSFGDDHLMVLYESAQVLSQRVSSFLLRGIRADHPALIIAREVHQRCIVDRLSANGVAVEEALACRRLVIVDAQPIRDRILQNGRVDGEVFDEFALPLFHQLARRKPHRAAYVYGEVVDLLWTGGRVEDAIALEILWNDLLEQMPMTVLCGYSMEPFARQSAYIPALLHQHTSAILPGHA
jgi:hypothetical protein